jgi:enamine deaminase RidA (YjgF/YER057c/UK114 family)
VSAVAGLAKLGLTLPPVATPLGAYVPAVVHSGLVWTSGALPVVDGELLATGVVGADVDAETAKGLARTAALNALAAAAGAAGGLEHISGVVKVTGYVASAPGFTGQPGVVNGASELYGQIFGGLHGPVETVLSEDGHHARSAVGVVALPNGAPVEIEVVFRMASLPLA